MEPILSADIEALEFLARDHAPFLLGTDPWLQWHWLTNAIDCGSASVVRWMLEKGASPVSRDEEGYTALHSAIEREASDKYQIMAMLIESGADLNARGVNDWTPAQLAAVRDDVAALRILYEAGASCSVRTRVDPFSTPLEEARLLGCSAEVVAFLDGH
ncbi:MAG: ankyrin repeat domain-containing protein [Fimbriimonadaceae bacterium]|nr:ankyrin repeat domain-containing protein [Fimbriimonadaceae bacterium]